MLKKILGTKLAACAAAFMLSPAAMAQSSCPAQQFYAFEYVGSEEVIVYYDVPATAAGDHVYVDGWYQGSWGHTYRYDTRTFYCEAGGYWR